MSVQLAFEIVDQRRDDLLDLDLKHAAKYLRKQKRELRRGQMPAAKCRCTRPMPDDDLVCCRCGRSAS